MLADRYGTDALRWWLLREVAPVGDTDFTTERLVRCADRDLANGLGNLVNRTLTLAHRHRDGAISGTPGLRVADDLADRIDRAVAAFDLRAATGAVRDVVDAANRSIEAERPWERPERLDTVLAGLVHACRTLAYEVQPFLPAGAARLLDQLGTGDRVGTPRPAFPRLSRR